MFKHKVNWDEELANLVEMGRSGKTMADVARHYGVSRQRVKQVVQHLVPDWKDSCGYFVRNQEKERKYQEKWGLKEDTDLYRMQRHKFFGKASNAKRVGKPWNVSFSSIEWPTHCPALGIELNYFPEGTQENSVSFDCTDPIKGYVDGNVRIISWRANRIKNDASPEELRKIADYLDKVHAEEA